jgi:hypothetical protein
MARASGGTPRAARGGLTTVLPLRKFPLFQALVFHEPSESSHWIEKFMMNAA